MHGVNHTHVGFLDSTCMYMQIQYLLGMPRYSIIHVICHGELCHVMLYVTT